jgi:hypothetical protein
MIGSPGSLKEAWEALNKTLKVVGMIVVPHSIESFLSAAKRLGITLTAMKARMFRARYKLAES